MSDISTLKSEFNALESKYRDLKLRFIASSADCRVATEQLSATKLCLRQKSEVISNLQQK